ncbi:hypothetical protein GQ53DRAFT_651922 [Thozetella sp. PMI_491]|nr:hypothetical protein GQ53DRAFT_651922 [Thozetella sp. PMI_491]
MSKRAMERHVMEIQEISITNIDNTEGNVLLIVKFPKDAGFACNGMKWADYYQRISYERLVATSSSKLLALLSPRKQDIFRRRHGFTTLPDGIEYILDLTPLDESDDHANVTCALWLPEGTKLWWLSGHFESDKILSKGPDEFSFNKRPDVHRAVGAVLALGHDDQCERRLCLSDAALWEVQGAHGIYKPGPGDDPIPEYRKIDGYCPVRHRVAIIRLLRAVNGAELLINSATRMWTLAQMAIHLELTDMVRDQVAQWFMASPNTKFIEMFPEVSFVIAYGLQLKDVLISSFQIMVNETAIDLVASSNLEPSSGSKLAVTWNLRQRDDYGDYPQDPVEHASRAFCDRINALLLGLRSEQCFDLMEREIPQWSKLVSISTKLDAMPGASLLLREACKTLMSTLVDAFIALVSHTMEHNLPTKHQLLLIDAQRAHFLNTKRAASFQALYEGLNENQRALTPFFWNELLSAVQQLPPFGSGHRVNSAATDFNLLFSAAVDKGEVSLPQIGGRFRFDPSLFQKQLVYSVGHLHHRVVFRGNETIQMVLSDHLILNLDDDELKFLPMWAGGLDDGSGGVFQEPVPNTEMGPIEPGPGYHTGHTIAPTDTDAASVSFSCTDTELGREIADLGLDDATVARSVDVQGSISTTPAPNRNRVIIAESVASEQFQSDTADFVGARYAEPADHQPESQTIAILVETPDEEMDYVIEEEEEYEQGVMSDDSDSTIGGSDYDMI